MVLDNLGLNMIVQNVGVSFEWIILIIFLSGGLIFMAKDFKLGLMVYYFFGSALIFMWYYYSGYNYQPILVIMFISFVLLALTLFAVDKADRRGQIV